MRGLLGPTIFILTLIIVVSGFAIVYFKPPGVALDCRGTIEGYGVPGVPITTFDSQCRAKVNVTWSDNIVCTGDGRVQGSASVISCPGLEDYKGKDLYVQAEFYNESGRYAKDEGRFLY